MHARVSPCSFEAQDQGYDLKRVAWSSVWLLASRSEIVGLGL